MEVKIGVQNAPRELTIDTDLDADGVEEQIAKAVAGSGVVSFTDKQGPPGRRARRAAGLRRDRQHRDRHRRFPRLTRPDPPSGASRSNWPVGAQSS